MTKNELIELILKFRRRNVISYRDVWSMVEEGWSDIKDEIVGLYQFRDRDTFEILDVQENFKEYIMLDSKLESKIESLNEKYLCSKGKCETVAGEILRAYNRIIYRYFNDGDVAGEGYGRETVNPALRYLFSQLPSIKHFFEINHYDKSIDFFDYDYETILNKIGFMILDHFVKRPELFTLTNFNDMLNFAVDSDHDWNDFDE